MDILNLKDKELRNYSLKETIDFIDEIGKFIIEQRGNLLTDEEQMVSLTELSDDLYSKVSIIQSKIIEDAFNETLPRNWKSKKENLLYKLFSIMMFFQNARDSSRVWVSIEDGNKRFDELKKSYEELEKDYNDKKASLESQIQNIETTTKETLKSQTTAITTVATETVEEIQGTEGKIVSHVLTLMGVFSAVITIILSIVVTSSSWLNNATCSSAIVAFVVPNLVALFAVISIVLLIYMYHQAFYPPIVKQNDNAKKAPTIISSVLLFSILIITILVSWLAYKYSEVDSQPHFRYVIKDSNYNVVEVKNKETDDVHKCFQFTLNGINYQFPFDKNILHDSELYYCSEHNALE